MQHIGSSTEASGVALNAMQARLDGLSSQLAEMESSLSAQHRLAMLGLLAAGVLHDLNNAATPLGPLARMALDEPMSSDRTQKALHAAVDVAHKIRHLSSIYMDIAANAEQSTANARLDTVLARMAEAGVETGGPPLVLADDGSSSAQLAISPAKLEQILTNLFINAAHAQSGGVSPIAVRCRAMPCSTGNIAEIAIEDRGRGLSSTALSGLFRPSPVKIQHDGHGIGLAFCALLLNHVGGSISISSRPGHGTTVRLLVPMATASGACDAAAA